MISEAVPDLIQCNTMAVPDLISEATETPYIFRILAAIQGPSDVQLSPANPIFGFTRPCVRVALPSSHATSSRPLHWPTLPSLSLQQLNPALLLVLVKALPSSLALSPNLVVTRVWSRQRTHSLPPRDYHGTPFVLNYKSF